MKEIKAPQKYHYTEYPRVFLAGSIEMGNAEKWQSKVVRLLDKTEGFVLSPRRDDWDSSWIQSKDNPQFREQVEWELDALENATYILLYFDPSTKSPISLLELGAFGEGGDLDEKGKMVVVCPQGFYRKGNVDIFCEKYDILQMETLEEAVEEIKERLTK